MKKISLLTAIAAISITSMGTASVASTVYDNGAADTTNGHGIGNGSFQADDFQLTANADITGVGFYYQTYNGISGWDGTVSYEILADNAGSIGASLASGEGQNVAAVDSGLAWCCGGGNAWLVTFDLQSAFSALSTNAYWLKLSGADSTGSSWWVTSASGGNSTAFNELAFYLTDDAPLPGVPVPAALPLLLGGFGLLGMTGRRRRKTS